MGDVAIDVLKWDDFKDPRMVCDTLQMSEPPHLERKNRPMWCNDNCNLKFNEPKTKRRDKNWRGKNAATKANAIRVSS